MFSAFVVIFSIYWKKWFKISRELVAKGTISQAKGRTKKSCGKLLMDGLISIKKAT